MSIDGDQLTIFDKENKKEIVWSDLVSLRRYKAFKEDAFGMWIHADQEGIEREKWARWFFEEYPAKLSHPGGGKALDIVFKRRNLLWQSCPKE